MHVYTYVCVHECKYVQYVCVYVYVCVYAGDSVRSWSPPSSATNQMYANANSDGGITMMENSAYSTQMDGITMMENPANVAQVYVQIYPTLPTRPRPITPGHPSTHNTSDSPSDSDYI